MSETGKSKKDEIIKDSLSRVIKGSEEIAIQAVDSAANVLKAGLDNAEGLTIKAGDILLNTARRAVNAGSVVASDVREVTREVVKGTIQTASEIGDEVKATASKAAGKGASTGKAEEKAE